MTNNKEKRMDKAMEDAKILLKNRLNVGPNAMTFMVSNRMIENAIEEYILDNLGNTEERFIVQCNWNDKFEPVFRSGENNGSRPFTVSVLTPITKKEFKKRPGNDMYSQTLNRVLHNMSDIKQRQFRLVKSPEMNRVLSSLAQTDNKGNLIWNIGSKKDKIAECVLDFDLVMSYLFSVEENDRKVDFDIVDRRYDRKSKEFTIIIAKHLVPENYKRNRNDRLEFLRRRGR